MSSLLGGRNVMFALSAYVVCCILIMTYLTLYNDPEAISIDVDDVNLADERSTRRNRHSSRKSVIHVVGTIGQAEFLWMHILKARLSVLSAGFIYQGDTRCEQYGTTLHFISGRAVVPVTLNPSTEHLVLVLNGRDEAKARDAEAWLDYLLSLKLLRNVGLVLLGDETCTNRWLYPYLRDPRYRLRFAFVVYDFADDQGFRQWPLGVSTYRGFPDIDAGELRPELPRKYLCNFVGTIYPDSSRARLYGHLETDPLLKQRCVVAARMEWSPTETNSSLGRYVEYLNSSDFTLCPSGLNLESYRIYEAMSLGSVPVVEDTTPPAANLCGCSTLQNCSVRRTLRLLKQLEAPVVFVNGWDDLPRLMKIMANKDLATITTMRRNVITWYRDFKSKLRTEFYDVLHNHFSF